MPRTRPQGLSTELGAFVAGVMLSTTDQRESALAHLEQIKAFFIALFIASTGLVMSPVFLAQHLPILTAGLILVVLGKTAVVRAVLKALNPAQCTCGDTHQHTHDVRGEARHSSH